MDICTVCSVKCSERPCSYRMQRRLRRLSLGKQSPNFGHQLHACTPYDLRRETRVIISVIRYCYRALSLSMLWPPRCLVENSFGYWQRTICFILTITNNFRRVEKNE